jgi:hypothetical protein
MKEKTKENYDFSDFLLDDDFVGKVSDPACTDNYIARMKEQFPSQVKNIDLALKVMEGMENKFVPSTPIQREKVWLGIAGAFKDSSGEPDNNRLNFKTLLKVAAGFILVIGIGSAAYYFSQSSKDLSIDRFAATTSVIYNQSQLILSDGKKIEVPAGEAKIRYSPDGEKVIINGTSAVQTAGEEQFNQVIVPYGKYVSLQLSDGTKVWLNSGSRMVYPPVFSGNQREVYLQGEGYFEVTKNAQKPFYVKTDRLKVEVLGTKFDVQAYEKENTYSALLLEGKVSLSTRQKFTLNQDAIILNPSEQGNLSENSNHFIVKKIEHPDNFIAWTYGYLNFEEESVESILKRVSRYYNIDIQLNSRNGSFKISGKLDLKNDPERVLKGITVIAKLKIAKQEGGFIISN